MTLEHVTVIIPAHNRPDRLRRLLAYYSRTNIRILVPDSSDLPFADLAEYPNIVYRHQPKQHFLLKIKEILPLINTPYVLYCADDDFTIPEAIAHMTDFLDNHPDYCSAQGHYLTFTPQKKKVVFYPRYIRYFDKQVTADTPRERLLQEKDMYASLLYAVIRADAFKKMYEKCFDDKGKLRFQNLFLAEEYFNHAALILGKYITLPYFYSAREFIEGSATSTTTPVYIVKSAPEYKEEYEGFLYSLAELLKEQEDQSFSGSQIQPPQQATESPSSAPLAQYPKELQQSGPLYTNPTFSTDDEIAFIRSISTMPKETLTITRKRKIKEFFRRNKYLFWLNRLADKRYNQKGLNIVKGMPSYPCSFNTPEKEEILRMISMKA